MPQQSFSFAEDTETYQSAEDSQRHFVAREVPIAAVIDMLDGAKF